MNLKEKTYRIILFNLAFILSLTFSAQANDAEKNESEKDKTEDILKEGKQEKKRDAESRSDDAIPDSLSNSKFYYGETMLKSQLSAIELLEEYKVSENKQEDIDKLEIAYALEPKNVAVLTEFVKHAEITSNEELKKEFVVKLSENNNFPKELKEYNKNVLKSIGSFGILITNGQTDTYPAWIQQEVNKENPGVVIWNLDLLKEEEYRNVQFKSVAIPSLQGEKTSQEIVAHIVKTKVAGEVYFALTLDHQIIRKYSSHLYLTGLALNYVLYPSENNLMKMKDNWENQFELTVNLSNHPVNRNYLLLMIQMYNMYDVLGDSEKKKEIKQQIKKLAKVQEIDNPLRD